MCLLDELEYFLIAEEQTVFRAPFVGLVSLGGLTGAEIYRREAHVGQLSDVRPSLFGGDDEVSGLDPGC